MIQLRQPVVFLICSAAVTAFYYLLLPSIINLSSLTSVTTVLRYTLVALYLPSILFGLVLYPVSRCKGRTNTTKLVTRPYHSGDEYNPNVATGSLIGLSEKQKTYTTVQATETVYGPIEWDTMEKEGFKSYYTFAWVLSVLSGFIYLFVRLVLNSTIMGTLGGIFMRFSLPDDEVTIFIATVVLYIVLMILVGVFMYQLNKNHSVRSTIRWIAVSLMIFLLAIQIPNYREVLRLVYEIPSKIAAFFS